MERGTARLPSGMDLERLVGMGRVPRLQLRISHRCPFKASRKKGAISTDLIRKSGLRHSGPSKQPTKRVPSDTSLIFNSQKGIRNTRRSQKRTFVMDELGKNGADWMPCQHPMELLTSRSADKDVFVTAWEARSLV